MIILKAQPENTRKWGWAHCPDAALSLAVFLFFLGFAQMAFAAGQEETFDWKFATVAPQGVGYANQLTHLILPVVEEVSGGHIKIKVYWGGAMGEDRDIIRKMRFGHLNGAGLTGYGTTLLCPEMAVLELPFLFESYAEVDYLRNKMRPRFEEYMAKSGAFLFGWIDQDFDQIYSSKYKMNRLEDFKKARFLTWFGPLEEDLLKRLGANPIPVSVTRISPTLKEGMADSAICPAIFVVGSQIFTVIKYANPMKIRYSPAVTVIDMNDWKSLPEKYVTKYYDLRDDLESRFNYEMRRDSKKFFIAIQKYGIQEVHTSPEDLEAIKQASRPLWDKLAGHLYPRELLDSVVSTLEEFRKTGKGQ